MFHFVRNIYCRKCVADPLLAYWPARSADYALPANNTARNVTINISILITACAAPIKYVLGVTKCMPSLRVWYRRPARPQLVLSAFSA